MVFLLNSKSSKYFVCEERNFSNKKLHLTNLQNIETKIWIIKSLVFFFFLSEAKFFERVVYDLL